MGEGVGAMETVGVVVGTVVVEAMGRRWLVWHSRHTQSEVCDVLFLDERVQSGGLVIHAVHEGGMGFLAEAEPDIVDCARPKAILLELSYNILPIERRGRKAYVVVLGCCVWRFRLFRPCWVGGEGRRGNGS